MKFLLLLSTLYIFASAQTPYMLTKIQSLYPLCEIYVKEIPSSYKQKITNTIKEYASEMKISTKGYSPRTLAIIVTPIHFGKEFGIKVQLLLGEDVKRLDDGEEVFALTYSKVDMVEIEDKKVIEEELMDSVEYLLEEFKDQYKEDNE